jgi:DNA-directed RNA polymerase I, II, and III subunit RPABC2
MADEEVYDDDGAGEEVVEDIGDFPDDEGADAVVEASGPKPSSETQILLNHHPEIWVDYVETIKKRLVRDPTKAVSYPFLNQFEKTKVLSFRASQLAQGNKPYIAVPDIVSDVYTIAKMELKERKLPYLIKRPLPDGDYEYWKLNDLIIFD